MTKELGLNSESSLAIHSLHFFSHPAFPGIIMGERQGMGYLLRHFAVIDILALRLLVCQNGKDQDSAALIGSPYNLLLEPVFGVASSTDAGVHAIDNDR